MPPQIYYFPLSIGKGEGDTGVVLLALGLSGSLSKEGEGFWDSF